MAKAIIQQQVDELRKDVDKILKEYLEKAGGDVSGALRFFMNDAFIAALGGADDSYGKRFIIDTYEDGKTGAAIDLMKGDSSQRPGEFAIHARNALATAIASLRGTPTGNLTWKDKLLIPVEVWQEPGGHGFYRIFDDGFCVQGALYVLGTPQSSFNVVVPLFRPLLSFAHFPLIVSTDGNSQTNISIANRTTTSFNALGSPNYGCDYTQQYILWVDFGFTF